MACRKWQTPEYKRQIWDLFMMSLPGETDPESVPFHWHWLMFPILDFFSPELVWSVGLDVLGYPPTLVDTKEESDAVEAALIERLNSNGT